MRRILVAVCTGASFAVLVPLSTDPPAVAATPVPICSYEQLEVGIMSGPGAAAGNIGIPFIIANVSKSTCTLYGYPRLFFTPSRYKNHAIKVTHNGGMVFPGVRPRLITIKPGGVASFGLDYGDAANQNDPNGAPCLVQNIYVTLPVRPGTYNANFETTTNFNFCFTDFVVGLTSIQAGPLPRQG